MSNIFLPEGSEACEVADLANEFYMPEPFDLVVCKDVLPYIPCICEATAIRNLVKLSSRFILLSWATASPIPACRVVDKDKLIKAFENEGFSMEPYMTARLRVLLKRKDCCLLIQSGQSILL